MYGAVYPNGCESTRSDDERCRAWLGAGAAAHVSCLVQRAAVACRVTNVACCAAAALRSRGLGVLRFPRSRRPSILGRDGFFVRYGDHERAAVATFDFLDDLSGSSSPENTKDCT